MKQEKKGLKLDTKLSDALFHSWVQYPAACCGGATQDERQKLPVSEAEKTRVIPRSLLRGIASFQAISLLDVKTISPNAVLEHLDEQIAWRELSVEAKAKKQLQK